MRATRALATSALLLLAALPFAAGQDARKPASATLTVVDSKDKSNKVTDWKWLSGTRRLGWLAGDEPKPKDKVKKGQPAAGPEAFALREETTINFAKGVTTLIPLDRLRKMTFDAEKKTLTVLANAGKDDVTLEGTTKYTGINWIGLEAEVDQGGDGVAAVKFQGGGLKGNVKSVLFPLSDVEAIKPGRPAVVQTLDKNVKKKHVVSDLMPLYSVNGGREKLAGTLMFRKTLKLEVDKLKTITDATEDDEITWRVVPKEGEERLLTLLDKATIDGQPAELLGFVGKVPVGYKLFPLRRIAGVYFDVTEVPAAELPKPDDLLPPPLEEKAK